MLGSKANAKYGGRWQVWLSGRGTSTDETKPCALPTQSDLETDADGSVSKSSTATAIAGLWLYAGLHREESLKLNGKAQVEMAAGGIPVQVSLPVEGEVESLEFTVAALQAFNALLDDTAVDIILKRNNSAECYYIRNVGITVEVDMAFSDKKANSIKIGWKYTGSKFDIGTLVTSGFPTATYDVYYGSLG